MANWDDVVMSVKKELTENECRILGPYCGLASPQTQAAMPQAQAAMPQAQAAIEAAFTRWQIDREDPPENICDLERTYNQTRSEAAEGGANMDTWDDVVTSVQEELAKNECRILTEYELEAEQAFKAIVAAFTLWQVCGKHLPQNICDMERIYKRLRKAGNEPEAAYGGRVRDMCAECANHVYGRMHLKPPPPTES